MFYLAFINKKILDQIEKIILDGISLKDMKLFYAFKYFQKFENADQIISSQSLKISQTQENYTNYWNLYEYFDEFLRMGVYDDKVIYLKYIGIKIQIINPGF